MSRHIHVATHLSVAELEQRYRAAHEPHERSWWQILWLLAGQTATAIARQHRLQPGWIGQIAKRYNAEGPAGMVNRQRTTSWRAPRMLSAEQQEELRQALAGLRPTGRNTGVPCGGGLDGGDARSSGATQRGWDYLQRLKQSQQAPRPRHALADAEQQEDLQKKFRPLRASGRRRVSHCPGRTLGDR